MRWDRTALLGAGLLGVIGVGWYFATRAPSAEPALDCPPDRVRWVQTAQGSYAACDAPDAGALPAGQALTLGKKLNLNEVTAEDLALLPGVGPSLAAALVEEREALGGFSTWDEVDGVRGIGPAKLEVLQQATTLEP